MVKDIGTNLSEKKYHEIVNEGLRTIERKYGKEKAEIFRLQENKERNKILDNILNINEEIKNNLDYPVFAQLNYSIFKDSLPFRIAFHVMGPDEIIKYLNF